MGGGVNERATTMIVVMRNGKTELVSNEKGAKLKKMINRQMFITVIVDGVTISLKQVQEIVTNEEFEARGKQSVAPSYTEVIRQNIKTLKETGKYGTLTEIGQLVS